MQNPDVTLPDEPVTELIIEDITLGDGHEVTDDHARTGTHVTVHYVGMGQASKAVFDSSFERNESISFPLNGVIAGWTQGLIGMKIGGRRQLTIPGELAYGHRSPTPAIGPNETLVFVVDLLDVG